MEFILRKDLSEIDKCIKFSHTDWILTMKREQVSKVRPPVRSGIYIPGQWGHCHLLSIYGLMKIYRVH